MILNDALKHIIRNWGGPSTVPYPVLDPDDAPREKAASIFKTPVFCLLRMWRKGGKQLNELIKPSMASASFQPLSDTVI